MDHKKQHWIPRAYLQAWCDPETPTGQEPYVWRFPREGGAPQKKAPKNIFVENEMYTIRLADGTRNLAIEHGLGGLETAFVTLRNSILDRSQEIGDSDRLLLCAFIAAMHGRTRAQRNHWQSQWGEIFEMMEKMREAAAKMTPEERSRMAAASSVGSRGRSLGYEEVKQVAERPMEHILVPEIQTATALFMHMNLTILQTRTDPGFITSDSPCVWFDPEAYKRPFPYNAVGLGYDTVEISLPISPMQMALLTHVRTKQYIDIPDALSDELNRRTRFHCEEHFIVYHNTSKPIWFEVGKPPGPDGEAREGKTS